MKNFLFSILLFLNISACNNISPREKELRSTLNKRLNLELTDTIQQTNRTHSFVAFREKYRNISVIYLQNSCNPCYPKFIDWQQKIDSISTPKDYTVLFIINGDSYDEFMTHVLDI